MLEHLAMKDRKLLIPVRDTTRKLDLVQARVARSDDYGSGLRFPTGVRLFRSESDCGERIVD